MGLLSGITKAAGSLLGGDTLKDVGNIIDDLHMSGEEKAEAKQKLNTKNEKQLVRILGGMWQKFGKNVTIGSSV